MSDYGSDGKWIPNMINWLIGAVIMQIWQILATYFFNWIMLWQTPLDGILAVYEGFAPEGVTQSYDSSMPIGNGGSWSSGDGIL